MASGAVSLAGLGGFLVRECARLQSAAQVKIEEVEISLPFGAEAGEAVTAVNIGVGEELTAQAVLRRLQRFEGRPASRFDVASLQPRPREAVAPLVLRFSLRDKPKGGASV